LGKGVDALPAQNGKVPDRHRKHKEDGKPPFKKREPIKGGAARETISVSPECEKKKENRGEPMPEEENWTGEKK